MLLPRAVPVTLTAAERTTLNKRARGARAAHRDRLRAQIVLAAARGRDNARIAADLWVSVDTVRKWRGRFAGRGPAGLADLPAFRKPDAMAAGSIVSGTRCPAGCRHAAPAGAMARRGRRPRTSGPVAAVEAAARALGRGELVAERLARAV
jgi:Winged helix-turn helix